MKSIISALFLTVLLAAAAVAQSGYSSSPYNSDGSSKSATQLITNGPVAETVSASSAFIGWSTKNSASSTEVRYGTSRDRLSQTVEGTDTPDGKNHHARLQDLKPDTTYYFQVIENGKDEGGIGTFKTVASGERPIQSKAVISQR